MMANTSHTVLYTGVTNNLVRSVGEDKSKSIEGFTKRYNVVKLVYFEIFEDPRTAIQREKTIKNMVRRKKNVLIESQNPLWKDLYPVILD